MDYKNQHLTTGLLNIAGHPFFLEEKHEEERIIQNSPKVVLEDKKIHNFLTEPFPDIDDSIDLNFRKTLQCNGVCITYADGCCHCEPMEESGYVKKVIK